MYAGRPAIHTRGQSACAWAPGGVSTRRRARSAGFGVNGHVTVDGKVVTVGSFVVEQGGKVGLTESGRQNQIALRAAQAPRLEVPDYLRKDQEAGNEVGIVQAMPGTEHVPFQFDAGLFTEYYAARKA